MEHLTESKEKMERGKKDSKRVRIKVHLKLQELKDSVFRVLTRRSQWQQFQPCVFVLKSHVPWK